MSRPDIGFPQFSRLPKELRLHVWDATLEPRFLRVGIGANTKSLVSEWSPQHNPIALSVCAESRARALKRYTLKMPIYQYHEKSAFRFAVRYIDPDRDLVFIDPSFKSAATSNWGKMNSDFHALKAHTFKKIEHLDNGKIRTRVAVRRLALPCRWWQFKCSTAWPDLGGSLWIFARAFFTEFREIYIIGELGDKLQQTGPSTQECSGALHSLLPVNMRADLQNLGWNIEVEGQTVKVTKTDSLESTRIYDFIQLSSCGMDFTVVRSPPGDRFFLQAPDVVYPTGHTCVPWKAPRRG